MAREPLKRAAQPKTTTLCPAWHFGGPHQWTARDTCRLCGTTRNEARVLAKYKLQPSLGIDQYGHRPPAGWTVFPWPPQQDGPALRLAVDNTREAR